MQNWNIYVGGGTGAIRYAAGLLQDMGASCSDLPGNNITHLLLDVPSFQEDGSLRSGGDIRELLEKLPRDITVIGGNLTHSALSGYRQADLLKDPGYLARNAAITAHCAITVTLPHLKCTLDQCPVLILGWGRIGKCLARLLRGLGAKVAVYARKPEDQAMLAALGYEVRKLSELVPYRIIYNTIPAQIPEAEALSSCPGCLKIELASLSGIPGDDVIVARGLPGRYAPESSGKLIAETVHRLLKKEDSL